MHSKGHLNPAVCVQTLGNEIEEVYRSFYPKEQQQSIEIDDEDKVVYDHTCHVSAYLTGNYPFECHYAHGRDKGLGHHGKQLFPVIRHFEDLYEKADDGATVVWEDENPADSSQCSNGYA